MDLVGEGTAADPRRQDRRTDAGKRLARALDRQRIQG